MKQFGIVLLLLGVLWLLFAFNMDTTVSTGAQSFGGIEIQSMRVNNLGKMDERRNHLLLSSLLIVVGVILFVFGNSKQSDGVPSQLPQPTGNGIQISDNRKCPYCAEMIRPDAIKCKHCGSDLIQTESFGVPKIKVTSKELLQKAYDNYNKIDIDGALDLFKTIILEHPNSSEAEAAKTKIKKVFVEKELLEKAYKLYYKTNDLSFFRVVIEVFPKSPQADDAKQQIEKNTGNG
ncbi:MAG: zinc ribbon domain-containing protein [Thermodesulfovibrionales bacterium]